MVNEETDKLRRLLKDSGVSYTEGYVLNGEKKINENITTNVKCKDGKTLSFEEDLAGRFTLFDLTAEQAHKAAVFLA